jgi:hypothetical protein
MYCIVLYCIVLYYIILYISLKKTKNFYKKNSKILWKKIVIFSNIFLPILHNIGLYIYIVKYKSGIKIPGFFPKYFKKKIQNILKKNLKNF